MNVHISYKISKTSDLETLIQQQTEKLGRYLQVFRPELVHLKGAIEENSAPQGFVASLNLRLPSGQMASQETSSNAAGAIKAAFDDIVEQLKKHKDLLRNERNWHRRRAPQRAEVATVPFEDTVAAVKPEEISSRDISEYVNVNFPRLQRYIQRELQHRVDQGQLTPESVTVEDVVNEAVAAALGEQEKPERIKLEPWIHRLAKQAIDRLSTGGHDEGRIALERTHVEQNVRVSDDDVLQFCQPDEKLYEANLIADSTAENPEELAARSELIDQVQTSLLDAGRDEREAFILYTIEGFTLDEIADITSHTVEEVRAAIRKAREHLQRALPMRDSLKDRLVEYSKSA